MIEFPRFMGVVNSINGRELARFMGRRKFPPSNQKRAMHMNYMEVLTMATNFKKKLFKDF
ncbi:hypothetical protein FOC52_14205 (plasmid) [Staphylococcus cohnii]|nr:hypothetical protein FOC52_14205 [Staphylococcus cohnii]